MIDKMMADGLYLDDLEVGMEFLSGEHPLDAAQIIAFATQFDPQPFHLDPEAARDSFFRGLAASGWHTMAITMRLVVDSMPFAQGIIGAGAQLNWPQPTRPGDILRVKSRVAEIRPSQSKPDRGMIVAHCLTFNQADEVLQDFRANLLVFRKGA